VPLDDQLIDIGGVRGIEWLQAEIIELFRGRNNSIYPDLAVIPMIGHRLTQPPAWRSA